MMAAMFTPGEVAEATRGKCLSAGTGKYFDGISTDTRTIVPGNLFVALSGENFDGHAFLEEAVRKGAAGLVVSRGAAGVGPETAVFLVRDTREAFQDLARFHRLRFRLPVIAVTGSNGKTSTKDMIASVLSSRMAVLKTEANFNNEIGLSQTLLRLDERHQAVVVEMGMRGRGEIAALADIARPTVGVVTNVGETHLERLGSIENIAAAKAELTEALDERGLAVLNGDDPFVRAMGSRTSARVVYYGMNSDVDVQALHLKSSAAGTAFECRWKGSAVPMFVPAPGIHNVYNALAAVATGLELGLDTESACRGLARFEPGKMRLNIRSYQEITVIDDTYNASPLSMAAAIGVLESVAQGRKLAAIGDMLELGAAARSAHENVGIQLAAAGVVCVLTLGELARMAGAAAQRSGVPAVVHCPDHQAAVRELRQRLLPGDTLLIKGSRGMAMEKLLSVFTDRTEG